MGMSEAEVLRNRCSVVQGQEMDVPSSGRESNPHPLSLALNGMDSLVPPSL